MAAAAHSEIEELAPYSDAIRDFPPLSRKEEHALAVRVRRGDVAAKQKLVRHNLGFVLAYARKYRRGTVRLEDLVQEGSVGLLRAADKFDPEAGNRFLTYAAWWIHAHIGKFLREARSAVRPQGGRVAPPDESLDEGVGDSDEHPLVDRIEGDRPDPEAAYLAIERDRVVREAVEKLRSRLGGLGWDIVRSRLMHDSPTTLAEMGKSWGLSRERVRQIEVRTKHLLRTHLSTDDVEATRSAA
jgi:RNA polymerase sigma factor (sigma-70 family)